MGIVFHRCGLRGCRVGEASNPGPVVIRQARRVEYDRSAARGSHVQVDVSSDDEVLVRPNIGRHVVARRDGAERARCRNHVESGHNDEVPSTVQVTGSGRFAAEEIVPVGTQELEDVGVVRGGSSFAGDQDQVPKTPRRSRSGFDTTQSPFGVDV